MIDRGIFKFIIAAVAIGVDVIRQRNGNNKLTGTAIIKLTQAVPSKRNDIDGCVFTKIYLDPATLAIADPG